MSGAGATIRETIAAVRPPDEDARAAAREFQSRLTKPAGSLGRLEELHVWAAGVLRDPAPALGPRAIVVAAADHGVAAAGVSAYPQHVTHEMVANMLAGGAAINVLARHAGARVHIVDAGIARDLAHPDLRIAGARRGTADFSREQAMTHDEAETLVARGIDCARELCAAGVRLIALGDMGIGNTTPAAAITSVITGSPPRATTGRGTGIDDERYARKLSLVSDAIDLHRPDSRDAVDVLAKVGGCEFAFLAGVTIGAASAEVPLVLDGYPTTAAALIAAALAPGCVAYMLASHTSAEPGHPLALAHLGLRPLFDLGLRLGEGTGAALAISLLDAALRLPREMATFDSAGVSRADAEQRPEM